MSPPRPRLIIVQGPSVEPGGKVSGTGASKKAGATSEGRTRAKTTQEDGVLKQKAQRETCSKAQGKDAESYASSQRL
ncbi:hypothetical protein M405DRAFT_812827 [Rhizopogon salebrosus TDB-379]|nr:hypothetical protein M405DRAFT_812827 [Rhizopogon salebrosus TDB-379]